jgi:hypothetical protein
MYLTMPSLIIHSIRVICVLNKSRRKSIFGALHLGIMRQCTLYVYQAWRNNIYPSEGISVICVPNKSQRKSVYSASSAFQSNPGANLFIRRLLHPKQISAQIPSICVICIPNKFQHKNQCKSLQSASSAFQTNPCVNPFNSRHLRSKQIPAQIPSICVICVPNKTNHKTQRKSLQSASSAFPINPGTKISANPLNQRHLRSQQIPA